MVVVAGKSGWCWWLPKNPTGASGCWKIPCSLNSFDGGGRIWSSNYLHQIILWWRVYEVSWKRYIKGKERYADLLDIDEFCVHNIDEMMETLGCVEEEPRGITHESDIRDDVDDSDDSDDSDDNIEWVGDLGGSNVKETETREIDDIEVVNNEVFLYGSSSNEGGSNRRSKLIKAIRRPMENSEARNIVRAICKGTIPDLGQLDPCGPSQSNKESEEKKCPWVLYASKWEQDVDWEIKTYEKEHICLQTRNVKACTYKSLAKKIVQQIESNPTVPTQDLQEQIQREYQVDISKMKVFKAKTEALNQVRDDYARQYTTLRYYVQELRTRNPGTTVKIKVKSEPNLASETRTFKRIYIYLGPLKKGFLAGKTYYLGLDGTFMKGPYPGMILTALVRCKYISNGFYTTKHLMCSYKS
ncbi:unnamed protein product [Lactuca saligna]|uniref:Uncharacterized protein n=1 Tax=Lactuca saligna TaxID=75948 RepID=A0AA35YTU0_LACSI|nr:unnamed protein product [Lactuca saligna]